MSKPTTPSQSRRSSHSVPPATAARRPSPAKRLSSESDRCATDWDTDENCWGSEKSLKRAQNPPPGTEGIERIVQSTDARLDGKALHGYIIKGKDGKPDYFKGRIPQYPFVKKAKPVRWVLKRSPSGNHGEVLNGSARKALSWPNGGCVGEGYTKVWGPVTREVLTPARYKTGAPDA